MNPGAWLMRGTKPSFALRTISSIEPALTLYRRTATYMFCSFLECVCARNCERQRELTEKLLCLPTVIILPTRHTIVRFSDPALLTCTNMFDVLETNQRALKRSLAGLSRRRDHAKLLHQA